MFAAHCPRHGQTVPLGLSDLPAVDNTGGAIVVDCVCFCGERRHTPLARRGAAQRRPNR
jgi:hypothetical protein